MILLASLTLLIGVSLGLASIGGFLLVPVLHDLGALALPEAIATSLLALAPVGLLILYGFHRQRIAVGTNAALYLLVAIAGGVLGATMLEAFSTRALKIALGLVVTLASLGGLADVVTLLGKRVGAHPRPPGRFTLGAVTLFSSTIAIMTGAGGPVVSIPMLLLIGVEVRAAIIAAQWMQISGVGAASLLNLQAGRVSVPLALLLMPLLMAGVLIGMRLARGLDNRVYRRLVGAIGVAVGLWLLWTALQ